MIKTLFVVLILIASFCECRSNELQKDDKSGRILVIGDTLRYSTPEEAGMSAKKIKEAKELFVNAVKENKVIGYQILVARKGKVVIDEAGGLRDLKNKLLMDKNTLLNMASNTKSVTAVGILKLADEGKISLDDFVSKYLPGFDKIPSNKITIKELLLHQGGFTSFDSFLGEITKNSPEEPDAPSLIVEAKKIGNNGPEVEPGTMFRYSNMGYNILGAVIEKVSHMKLDEYFKENIYKPLGMNKTGYFLKKEDSIRVSKQYYLNNGNWERMETLSIPFARASGGIISNVWDFSKFCQMLSNKGIYNNHRILKEKTVVEATLPIIKVPAAYLPVEIEKGMGLESEWYEYRDARDLNFDIFRGYGFVVSKTGAFSHAGIYGTYTYIDPNNDLIILILTQSIYGGNPGQKFIETIYDSINISK